VVAQLVVAVLLGLFAAYCIVVNAMILVMQLRGRHISFLPLLGGIAGAGAMLIEPSGTLRAWCWLPFVVDLGSLPYVLGVGFFFAKRARDM
jgi:hypothetical protein